MSCCLSAYSFGVETKRSSSLALRIEYIWEVPNGLPGDMRSRVYYIITFLLTLPPLIHSSNGFTLLLREGSEQTELPPTTFIEGIQLFPV